MIKIGSWAIPPGKVDKFGSRNQVGAYCSWDYRFLWDIINNGDSFIGRGTTAYGLMSPTINYIRDYLLRD